MKTIVVVDENWAIGREGGLLLHLPGDLRYFKEKTIGKTIVMGRTTLESLPGGRPLPGRKTIVLSKDGSLQEKLGDAALAVSSRGALFDELTRTGQMDECFIAGGQNVYEQFLPYCSEVLVTKLEKKFEGADRYFPDLDAQGVWDMTWESELQEEKGVRYRFTVYRKK